MIEMSHPADRLGETPRVSKAWTVEKGGRAPTYGGGSPG